MFIYFLLFKNGNIIKNLKQLDLKARELIDKSESTLNDRVSSDGLGSTTTSSTLTANTHVSSNIAEEATFKPDFVKYLESKTFKIKAEHVEVSVK